MCKKLGCTESSCRLRMESHQPFISRRMRNLKGAKGIIQSIFPSGLVRLITSKQNRCFHLKRKCPSADWRNIPRNVETTVPLGKRVTMNDFYFLSVFTLRLYDCMGLKRHNFSTWEKHANSSIASIPECINHQPISYLTQQRMTAPAQSQRRSLEAHKKKQRCTRRHLNSGMGPLDAVGVIFRLFGRKSKW